jgi:hypothetical protein
VVGARHRNYNERVHQKRRRNRFLLAIIPYVRSMADQLTYLNLNSWGRVKHEYLGEYGPWVAEFNR